MIPFIVKFTVWSKKSTWFLFSNLSQISTSTNKHLFVNFVLFRVRSLSDTSDTPPQDRTDVDVFSWFLSEVKSCTALLRGWCIHICAVSNVLATDEPTEVSTESVNIWSFLWQTDCCCVGPRLEKRYVSLGKHCTMNGPANSLDAGCAFRWLTVHTEAHMYHETLN